MKTGILYLSYSGMLESLGQSQVLAYQERLSDEFRIHILSFERVEDWTNQRNRYAVEQRMKAAQISWHSLKYHKRPASLATAWDILAGIVYGLYLGRKYNLSIVHARSYVPSVMALVIKRLLGAKYIFDMRGFWADERVDGGIWPQGGRMYRIAKWFERKFLLNADHVVSLTNTAVRDMESFDYLVGKMPPVTVIPTCADLDKFAPGDASCKGEFVLGYVGSVGTWNLFPEVIKLFKQLFELLPEAKILILNKGEHDYIRAEMQAANLSMNRVDLKEVCHANVPFYLARISAGVFFIKPAFSKRASAPTRFAEFLGCGVPCLSNKGVGDVDEIFSRENVGVILSDFSSETITDSLAQLIDLARKPETAINCRFAAEKYFSLDEAVARYRHAYRLVLALS